jgi:signal transduction histidine kinase
MKHFSEHLLLFDAEGEKMASFSFMVLMMNSSMLFIMNAFILGLTWVYISNNKHILKVLNVLLDKAKRSDASKDIFIAAMSHEFRNPLNSMLCSIDVLKCSGLEALNRD